jgi:hypothetical protein
LPRRAGKYWGLRIECPVCGERPTKLKQHQRWRWLAAHLATHKPRLHSK